MKLPRLPLLFWLQGYTRTHFISDLIAGCVTAFVAVPQTMAYAQLAGLPAEYGLYSSLLPLLCYALLGSSRTLVVGPAALICLMVASAIAKLAPSTPEAYIQVSVNLALLTGLILMLMSALRLGNFANLISKPVITGFTSASALIIATSQVNLLLGISTPKGMSFIETLTYLPSAALDTNISVLVLSLSAIAVLWSSKSLLPKIASLCRFPPALALAFNKSGPLLAVLLGTILVASLSLDTQRQVSVLGHIPNNLPSLSWSLINIQMWEALALPSFSIALICFLTSISTGATLASKNHERVNANQELLALGVTNVGAALTGTFALAGSVSRSMVNYATGAATQVANIISALIVLLTILFLTPYFYYLPQAVLGAIVIMSVLPMIELSNIKQCWRFNKADAISLLVTFFAALLLGVELGIWAGIGCSIVLFLHRSSQPHIAEVGRAENGYFRNIKRLHVETLPNCVFLRIDESLYFANVQHVENYVMKRCAQAPELEHLVLIFSSVSSFDESALESLENLIVNLRNSGVTLHLSDVKGIIQDQLRLTDIFETLAPGQLFYTADEAMNCLKDLSGTNR